MMGNITVVFGSPCSGKSHYIRENANSADLIFDYDAIRSAISTEPHHKIEKSDHHGELIAIREFIATRNKGQIWIATRWPTAKLCEILPDNAEFVRMDVDADECIDHLMNDETRPDKSAWTDIIRDWYKEHGDQEFGRSVFMKETNTEIRTDENKRYCFTRAENFKTRDDGGNPIIEGYFAVFNTKTELWPGGFESIAPTAFDNSVSGDVRALINHDTTLVIGRTTIGTLELKTDSRGLWGRVKINPKDSDAMNIHARVERGDVDQCSFGFYPRSEETEIQDDGSIHWTLTDVDLFEVSCCTFPAYKETSIQARKRDAEAIAERKRDAWKIRMMERFNKSKQEEN
jgi:hypothetical protein